MVVPVRDHAPEGALAQPAVDAALGVPLVFEEETKLQRQAAGVMLVLPDKFEVIGLADAVVSLEGDLVFVEGHERGKVRGLVGLVVDRGQADV